MIIIEHLLELSLMSQFQKKMILILFAPNGMEQMLLRRSIGEIGENNLRKIGKAIVFRSKHRDSTLIRNENGKQNCS